MMNSMWEISLAWVLSLVFLQATGKNQHHPPPQTANNLGSKQQAWRAPPMGGAQGRGILYGITPILSFSKSKRLSQANCWCLSPFTLPCSIFFSFEYLKIFLWHLGMVWEWKKIGCVVATFPALKEMAWHGKVVKSVVLGKPQLPPLRNDSDENAAGGVSWGV